MNLRDIPLINQTSEHKVILAMDHLRRARELLKQAHAKRALERVRLAISSCDGARRHAVLEPYRRERQMKKKGGA